MNNTVSPKQVQVLEDEIDSIFSIAKVKTENACNEFLTKISNKWADEYSVTFAKNFTNSMSECINALAKSANDLKGKIVDIANFYAQRAGKSLLNVRTLSFNSAINSSIVKSSFADGEYGIKDINSVADLSDELNGLSNTYKDIAEELKTRVASINAFGNSDIKNTLLKVSNGVMDILNSSIVKVKNDAESVILNKNREYSSVNNVIADAFKTTKKYSGSYHANRINTEFNNTNKLSSNDNKGYYYVKPMSDDNN